MFPAKKIITELSELISFPSVSSSRKKQGIYACANWLAGHLRSIGMQRVSIFKTSSHPVVFGEYTSNPLLPVVLFYGHYDVQPADPVNEWHTDPFKATTQGDYLYGRGASDDKGQFFIHIKAVENLIRQTGSLPVNVKFLVEGAEEIGSPGLKAFIAANQAMLQCNVVVVSDTKMYSADIPAITYSLRGALNATLSVHTAASDLHSGTFGGSVPNATTVLSELLSSLHRPDNTIAIPGFYNQVKSIDFHERNFMWLNGPDNPTIFKDAGAFAVWGEKNYSLYERTTLRPALMVTGITGGYTGEGSKNAIPATAMAKLNFRLVPGQDPKVIQRLTEIHVQRKIPVGIQAHLDFNSHAHAVEFSRNDVYIMAAARAYQEVFQRPPRLLRSGGTIPAVGYLHTLLRRPVVLMGFAQAGDNMHAPNERFYLPNLYRGIKTSTAFIKALPAIKHFSSHHDGGYLTTVR